MVPAEQEVLPAQGKRPDGILHEVVVDAEASVVHIVAQSGKQRQRIADGLPDAAVLRCPPGGLVHPLLELKDHGIRFYALNNRRELVKQPK